MPDDWIYYEDGSYEDSYGDLWDYTTGEWLGYNNYDGSWTDADGYIYDDTNNVIGVWLDSGNWIDNAGNLFNSANEPLNGSGNEISGNLYAIPDGTHIDAQGNIVRDDTGQVIGTTAELDAAVSGDTIAKDPDQFGDVFTKLGSWIGNIFGLGKPTAGTGRGPTNTPGGAYSTSGFSSGSSAGNVAQQLQQMLAQARATNAPVSQQAALSAALANAQGAAGMSTTEKIALGALAVAALYVLTRNRAPAPAPVAA